MSFRFPSDARHRFAGTEVDRDRPLTFRLNGRRVSAYSGDTVLSALLASGIEIAGTFDKRPVRLGANFAPLIRMRKGAGQSLPMERALAADGDDWVTVLRPPFWPRQTAGSKSLNLQLSGSIERPWEREHPTKTLSADLVVVGGGVAGMAAALEAAAHGRTAILIERRTWLGGDATLDGQFGDEESPEALTGRLKAELEAQPTIQVLSATEGFAIDGSTILAHQVEHSAATILALTGQHVVLATGGRYRLPLFPGNRLPGVIPLAEAYHFAERFGVGFGRDVTVATQANWGYRAVLRFADAGLAIQRIIDSRPIVHSRFVDFAKASGLLLAPGQKPLAAQWSNEQLQANFGETDGQSLTTGTEALLVAGALQPDLALWLRAGGQTEWNGTNHRLEARGRLPHVALAGSAAGFRSLPACEASGRAAQEMLVGTPPRPVSDRQLDERYETREAPTPVSTQRTDAQAFLDDGLTLRLVPQPANLLPASAAALTVGEVAALVDLRAIQPEDAGAVAEERSTQAQDLAAASWTPPATPEAKVPVYLTGRFGSGPIRALLQVDGREKFETGALVFRNTGPRTPQDAIGVIVSSAAAGGVALLDREALETTDRLIVDTLRRLWPARIIWRADAD